MNNVELQRGTLLDLEVSTLLFSSKSRYVSDASVGGDEEKKKRAESRMQNAE